MTEFPFEKTNDQDILLANAKKAISMCRRLDRCRMRFFFLPDVDYKQMPKDEYFDFVLTSTYKLAAYLIYCRLHLNIDCYKNDRDFYDAYREVLQACTMRDFLGHAKNSLNGLVDTMEILIEAPLKPYHYHYCDNFLFYACVEKSFFTLPKIAKGTAHFPLGKDEKLMARADKLLDIWDNSSSKIE